MKKIFLFATALLTLAACSDDNDTQPEVIIDPVMVSEHTGVYILNEGPFGQNLATLDFLDFGKASYTTDVYTTANPDKVMGLGDTGNDVKQYGSKLWMTLNGSNKVEVVNAYTVKSIGQVEVNNCRFLAFHEGYAYVTSYVSETTDDAGYKLGEVVKIDTASLSIAGRLAVGYEPEQMAVVGNKLYVVNSGGNHGYTAGTYDNTVSVINLTSFTKEKDIEVGPNNNRISADQNGRLWVCGPGNYYDVPSRIYYIDNDKLAGQIDVPVSNFDIAGDSLVYYGTSYAADWSTTTNTGIISTNSATVIAEDILHAPDSDPFGTVYGIMTDRHTGLIYVMDAGNYTSSGKLFIFDSKGAYIGSYRTGIIPGHACFLTNVYWK